MAGRLNFEYGFNTNTAQPVDGKTPMRVYFLGDFTGPQTSTKHSSTNTIVKIDLDNFDDVMNKLSPSVTLPSGQQLTFNELEDFHPDNLFENPIFKNLRRLKGELNNSATADNAAKEILSNYQLGTEPSLQVGDNDNTSNSTITQDNDVSDENSTENKDDMFERLLGQKQSSTHAITTTSLTNSLSNIDQFLSNILTPHIIKDAKPEHKSLILFINTAIEELMKSILHLNEFQALESAWRSVRDVIFNEEYDEENQFFYLVNTNRNALESAVNGDTNFVTKLSHHIKNIDDDSYDILVGNYQFSATSDDVTALNYLASIAETLKCQFVSAANESLINANAESLWQQFRKTPQAKSVALSYPQVLLRIPYGKKHDEVDAFAFEEFSQTHQHNRLVWGNSAFTCARLLIRQYHSSENGQAKFDTTIIELPAFVYTEDDTQILHPCGEVLLSEPQLINIKNKGFMVFISYRNKNCIRLFGDGIHAVNAS